MKRRTRLNNAALASLAAMGFMLVTSHFAVAQDAPPTDGEKRIVEQHKPDYSPYPDQSFPNRVYWGVAHVHTGYSSIQECLG